MLIVALLSLTACTKYENGQKVETNETKAEETSTKEEPKKENETPKVDTTEKDSLVENVKTAIHKEFGQKNDFNKEDSIIELTNEDGLIKAKVYGSDNVSTQAIKEGMWIDVSNTLKRLKDEKDINHIDFLLVTPLQDQYGKATDEIVMTLSFPRETLDKIDWNNFMWKNIPEISEDYFEHPVLSK